jgi:hypothetical protein
MKISYSARDAGERDRQVFSNMSAQFARAARSMGADADQLTPDAREMRANRRVNGRLARAASLRRSGAYGGGASAGASSGFSDIQFATGRPRDPLFYWRQNNLPYDFSQNEELAKVRAFCRLLYQTDPVIGACVDIFSKFPVMGWSLESKDAKLEDFYGELFFNDDDDNGIDYDEFLVDIGREYFVSGEAWPFATFDEDLGIWSDEELLNPDDIKVERSPFLKEPRYFIRLPWTIRQILQTRQPAWEYNKLIQEYPELAAYTSENAYMPVSNVLLKQLKFKGDTFNIRGLPLLTRAMRSMLQQEMLNTAMDAIADRLYTPLILCKLGASASDLGTSVPWIPTDDDLENFELALDAALAADFRALVYNFGVEMLPVLGRENMPDLTPDFERIEDRVLMVFGLSRSLLIGAQEGQTYAADALNRDLVTMLMSRYQKFLARHFRQRALIVAEAQEHYDYEERNGQRYVIMEEVLETDEETGEKHIVEQPRLLVPRLRFRTLNFKDEDVTRQFIEALRASGIPISMRTRTRDLGLELDEEIERSKDEAVETTVGEQETRKRIYTQLRDAGLPIAPDLLQDFMPKAQEVGVPPTVAAEMIMQPRLGMEPVPLPNMAPTPEDIMASQEEEGGPGAPPGEEESGASDPGGPDDGEGPPGDQPQRPEESDEQRKGMPRNSSKRYEGGLPQPARLFQRTARMRDLVAVQGMLEPASAAEHAGSLEEHVPDHPKGEAWFSGPQSPGYDTPRHVGMRRHLGVTEESADLVSEDRYARR